MKIRKQSHTNYTHGKLDASRFSHKIGSLLDDAIPKTILGMLSTVEEQEHGLLFYKRWELVAIDKHDYAIFDRLTKSTVYEHISLLKSALHMIYHLDKASRFTRSNDRLIYALDQQYFRCLENIKLYKKKLTTVDLDRSLMFSSRLQDSYYKLEEIKTQLSKIY
jgi:hypothetical protein